MKIFQKNKKIHQSKNPMNIKGKVEKTRKNDDEDKHDEEDKQESLLKD